MNISELNNLSIAELRQLNTNVVNMIKHKLRMEGAKNSVNLAVGMTVQYVGAKAKISGEKFRIEKINSVNAQCRSLSSGTLWNIKLANIEPST